MWNKPWGYKEGVVVGAGLTVIGLLLQLTIGHINWDLIAFPINLTMLVAYVVVLILMHHWRQRVYLFRWLSSATAAVSSLAWAAVFTVVMGLTRQMPSGHEPIDAFGFSQMVSSWAFVLLYLWLTTVLGLTILRTTLPFKKNRLAFLLSHVGLFIAIVSATLGSADMKRLTMTTRIGEAEWRAENDRGQVEELPLAIELEGFTIDEYPPKLMLIDNSTGAAQPKDAPEHVLLEEGVSSGRLADWQFTVAQSISMAAAVNTVDTLKFTEFHSMGATYAVYLKAINTTTQAQREGWVSCGSFMFPYKALRLDDKSSIVMPEREPQRFASAVTVYTKAGEQRSDTVEVNKPMNIAGWKIYQLSYDETKGRWSDISVFELVRDPWLPAVYAGILMMAMGAICLFATAQRKRKEAEQ